MTAAPMLASAVKDLASTQRTSFATTQAVWRFLKNDRISFQQLNQPIETIAIEQTAASLHQYALVVHDWSSVRYTKHSNKLNRLERKHQYHSGYDLQSSLLVDAQHGLPIAPLSQTLGDAIGRHCTFADEMTEKATHLNALLEQIDHIESLPIEKTLVHIIDREGDSIAHQRLLNEKGYQFLIRGKEANTVEYQGKILKIEDVSAQVPTQEVKQIQYKGAIAYLHVGETSIRIIRSAKPKTLDHQGKRVLPQVGDPLHLRLIVAVVTDHAGKTLARWSLLSNVAYEIDSVELSRWYYWRWTIESYFKLLKQAGYDLESWLQTTPQAILRRLLIVSMACVLIWRIQRAQDEQSLRVRAFLTRLSGRQQKRNRVESAPSLLAGLSILLNSLQLLTEYSETELKVMARMAIGYS